MRKLRIIYCVRCKCYIYWESVCSEFCFCGLSRSVWLMKVCSELCFCGLSRSVWLMKVDSSTVTDWFVNLLLNLMELRRRLTVLHSCNAFHHVMH